MGLFRGFNIYDLFMFHVIIETIIILYLFNYILTLRRIIHSVINLQVVFNDFIKKLSDLTKSPPKP